MRYLMQLAAVLYLLCPNIGNARDEPPVKAATSPALTGLPIEMTVKQRSTTVVPGSGGTLRLTIDDITHGQVRVSLSRTDGTAVMAPVSLTDVSSMLRSASRSQRFQWGAEEYRLRLKKLHNALVGQDFADFTLDRPGPKLTEQDKIEKLIQSLGKTPGTKFIRNDTEYSADDAMAHLRKKWEAAGKDKLTAQEFIVQIASKSSTSGKPYRIVLPDGQSFESWQLMLLQLGEIEKDE